MRTEVSFSVQVSPVNSFQEENCMHGSVFMLYEYTRDHKNKMLNASLIPLVFRF